MTSFLQSVPVFGQRGLRTSERRVDRDAEAPGGLADGNDDLGAMSAWYVWSALGMFPETPGTSDLALGSPLFTPAVEISAGCSPLIPMRYKPHTPSRLLSNMMD